MNATANGTKKSSLTLRQLQALAEVHGREIDWPAECAKIAAEVERLTALFDSDAQPFATERAALTARFGEGNYHLDVSYASDGAATYSIGLNCWPYNNSGQCVTTEAAVITLLRKLATSKRDHAKAEAIKAMAADDCDAVAKELEHKAALAEQTVLVGAETAGAN